MIIEPPHSPPTAKPCASRSTTRSSGANAPIVAYPGSRPMRIVLSPITVRVTSSVDLRPWMSPRWPKNSPPSGRARNPTANVPNAARVATNPSAPGKKTFGNTTAAAVP